MATAPCPVRAAPAVRAQMVHMRARCVVVRAAKGGGDRVFACELPVAREDSVYACPLPEPPQPGEACRLCVLTHRR